MAAERIGVRYGIDMLLAGMIGQIQGQRVGLVTNDAAATSATYTHMLTPTRLALQEAGVNLVSLFSPEHGLGAAAADGAEIGHGFDPLTGLPVHSLYGESFRPSAEQLDGLDLLLFDIPDVGARFYTYIWTLSHVMEACAEAGLPLWVLDRPNPLGGYLGDVEGPMLDEARISTFVGRWNIPIRHCLTAGELARLWHKEKEMALELMVVKMAGWLRKDHWPATGNPFVPMSPSMPSYEAALVYPGTCLFEGTNVSEARGTANPFQQVGSPWMDSLAVSDGFNAQAVPGIVARPVQFTPINSKYAGQLCFGVMLHGVEPERARPVQAGLVLLSEIIDLHREHFAWLPYPTAANAPGFGHFDRLVGQLHIRESLDAQLDNLRSQITGWTAAGDWARRVGDILLYYS
ncbi:MAG: DUF1343 domain-containing protein [Caldilineaceae bacterium]|nr:DUF1343 domain-containing protein [Caldilineaceae bacterium]